VLKNEKRIYFVAETKSTLDADKRRKEENQKIKCGERHFDVFDEVNFKEVTKVSELMR
jgi:type III restriction enzyme